MSDIQKGKIDIEIGQRLRTLRDIQTAKGLAGKLGIPESTYRSYEYGQRHVPDRIKVKIAAYYNKSVDEIFYA